MLIPVILFSEDNGLKVEKIINGQMIRIIIKNILQPPKKNLATVFTL
jgi:hypothetical protein